MDDRQRVIASNIRELMISIKTAPGPDALDNQESGDDFAEPDSGLKSQ